MTALQKENPPRNANSIGEINKTNVSASTPINLSVPQREKIYNPEIDILQLLKKVSGSNGQYKALCPAHNDKEPSLSIKVENGKYLFRCHVGCSFESIMDALRLPVSAAFPAPMDEPTKPNITNKISYDYHNPDGSLAYRRERIEYSNGSKKFYFRNLNGTYSIKGVNRVPYNLPAVINADTVYIVEGEKCVHAINKTGRVATTLDSGAESKWLPEYAAYFEGKNIIILPDNDTPGMKYAKVINTHLPGSKIVLLPGLSDKGDIYDWLKAGNEIEEIDDLPGQEIEIESELPKQEQGADNKKPYRTNKQGNIIKDDLYNFVIALENYGVANELFFDTFSERIFYQSEPITDNTKNEIAVMIAKYTGLSNQNHLKLAIANLAYQSKKNVIIEHLNSLPKWDGVPRIETLFIDCLGAKDTLYIRECTKLMFMGALTRLYSPGAKFDYVIVLEGEQGAGKSYFISKLAMRPEWFTDSVQLSELGGKTIPEKIQNKWIVELPEITTGKSDLNKVKAFLTTQDDNYRVSYGTYAESHKRKCIFVASVNPGSGYLSDVTGNRRFLPIETTFTKEKVREKTPTPGTINQVWAEALQMFSDLPPDYIPMLPESVWDIAEDEQRRAMMEDPMKPEVEAWIEKSFTAKNQCIEITVNAVFDNVFYPDPDRRKPKTRSDANIIISILQQLGYVKYPHKKRIDGVPQWFYVCQSENWTRATEETDTVSING